MKHIYVCDQTDGGEINTTHRNQQVIVIKEVEQSYKMLLYFIFTKIKVIYFCSIIFLFLYFDRISW